MRQREFNKFTGFIAYYNNGKFVREKENYLSQTLHKTCATNWAEIDKEQLIALELHWNGQSIVRVDKANNPDITSNDWFFTQSAIFDMTNKKLVVLDRNIGYTKKDGTTQVYSVNEATGRLVSYVRG